MENKSNILIVEDDLNLGFLLMEFLEAAQYKVKLCKDGASALEAQKHTAFDLGLLDISLPDIDGFELARRIKRHRPNLPFLFLTARTMKEDVLRGYSLGAEDYVTKPFDEEELLWRIRVILRRESNGHSADKEVKTQFSIGAYTFDYKRRELAYKGEVHRVTETENEVLRLLCINKNQILNREEAVELIYGKRDYFLGRSFDVFISRIRKLLNRDPSVSIENVFKVGFILHAPTEKVSA